MGTPKFSVVTISFNPAEFLERAIRSVIGQEGAEFEYIMIDPGSTDGSREIIERYRPHFAHVLLESDKGPADGLNSGLALAKGEYFYYLNSDDEIESKTFRQAAAYLEKHPVDVLYGNGVVIDRDSVVLREVHSAPVMSADLYARGLAHVVQQASFVRTSMLHSIGGFNAANRSCWDGEAFFDIARAGGTFKRVWRNWGRFRVYGSSISGSGKFEMAVKREEDRLRGTLPRNYNSPLQRMWTLALWVLLHALDFKRWPSYLRGRFNAARVVAKQGR